MHNMVSNDEEEEMFSNLHNDDESLSSRYKQTAVQCQSTTFCQSTHLKPKAHRKSSLQAQESLDRGMSVRVFADMLSQPARAVTIFCCAAHIPHQVIRIRVVQRSHYYP